MRKNRQGFTLVELLAVIVILAVIAVIAVPQVLKIIETSRQDAFRASIRSAFKAAQLAVVNGETSGSLKELNMNNNSFIDGGWGLVDNKIVIFSAMTNNYTVGKVIDSTVSGEFTVIKEGTENSYKTLASRMTNALLGGNGSIVTTEGATKGYIRGSDPNNYVNFNGIIWRIVKVNGDGSILMVAQDNYSNSIPYHNNVPLYETGTQNNFANSTVKDYLNNKGDYIDNGFYNTISHKEYIKNSSWDTKCTDGTTYAECSTGAVTTITNPVGLLTHYDYTAGTGTGSYLNTGNFWWLGTGYNTSFTPRAWFVAYDGTPGTDTLDQTMYGIRPAIVLQPGITITGGTGGAGEAAYTIE